MEEEHEEALFVAELDGFDGDDDAAVVGSGEDLKSEMSEREKEERMRKRYMEMARSRGGDG